MAQEIVMPKLGLTMEKGKIVKWYKQVGDEIAKGEVIFEVETEKITNEVEANFEGELAKIIEEEGATVAVTEAVAVMAEAGEDIEQVAVNYSKNESSKASKEEEEKEEAPKKKVKKKEKKKRKRIKVSPKAKRVAKEKGVEIEEVAKITGGKRITSDDIDKYLEAQVEKKEEETKAEETKNKQDLSQMRLTIANRLAQSWKAPHIYLRSEVEVDEIIRLREKFKENQEQAPSLTDIISKAVITSLKQHPNINATWEEDNYYLHDNINLGLAVAVEEGLIVPVIKKAQRYNLMELSNQTKELAQKGRNDNLDLDKLQGGTFTITNLGMYGIDEFTAIINPPQVAILAVGTIKDILYKNEVGEIREKKVMNLTLGLDHRAIDGAMGAEFLQTLKSYIENPALMI
ncbi:2-oxo acid dehydrogenase subunit E2 [Natroniella acetigena]|uniref:dihydrolipoamide acetyltransferase family protein n=1 Tax=Natroniella acetigena TaxID=52004 RepID=UPI00200B3F3D|nr:dihydrolipoamide acetyltransferase family protein [Natroniella acetigena]MCK8827065.1 2-oxo acid dehydrogenase subunit E2 [Natroniella acetigena]